MKFEIALCTPQQLNLFKEVIRLFHEIFEESELKMAGDDQLLTLLMDPNFKVFMALKDNQVVGGITAYKMLSYYRDSAELYIYDIAVDLVYQNRGIGKMMIDYLKKWCKEGGISLIMVEAHSEDQQAVNFYRRTFGKPENVSHFNLPIS